VQSVVCSGLLILVLQGPVRGSWILKLSGTGPVRGPSKKGNRIETGPGFKALVDTKQKLLSHLPPDRPKYLCEPLVLGH
jgi:hypothetical protein